MCTRVFPADTYSIHVLQPHNSETLCEAVIQVAQSHAPNLVEDATAIAHKFKHAFSLFSCCHLVYDSAKLLEDTVINELGNHKHQHVYTCNTDSCFLRNQHRVILKILPGHLSSSYSDTQVPHAGGSRGSIFEALEGGIWFPW